MTDWWDVLGCARDASDDVVRERFRTLAQIYHPDRHVDAPDAVAAEAAERMRELNAALAEARLRSPMHAPDSSSAHASTADPEPTRPIRGTLYVQAAPVLPVAHPLTMFSAPPQLELGHPNVAVYVGDMRSCQSRLKDGLKASGFHCLSQPPALVVARTRLKRVTSERVIVRFADVRFGEDAGTSGTAVCLYSTHVGFLMEVRGAIAELPWALPA